MENTMAQKYKFKIESDTYEWETQFITGAEIRSVGPGIPASMDLYMKVAGSAGSPVANDQQIDLSQPGIEKFYSQDASSDAG